MRPKWNGSGGIEVYEKDSNEVRAELVRRKIRTVVDRKLYVVEKEGVGW